LPHSLLSKTTCEGRRIDCLSLFLTAPASRFPDLFRVSHCERGGRNCRCGPRHLAGRGHGGSLPGCLPWDRCAGRLHHGRPLTGSLLSRRRNPGRTREEVQGVGTKNYPFRGHVRREVARADPGAAASIRLRVRRQCRQRRFPSDPEAHRDEWCWSNRRDSRHR